MRRVLLPALALLLIVGTGVVHGMRTDRWKANPAVTEAVARLGALPERIGDWQGEDVPLAGREPPGVAAHVCRRFTHARTGDAITLFLVCGRPGPVAIHTPDVCYGASGYTISPPTRYAPPASDGGEAAQFWTADMVRTTSADRSRMRIFWAWNCGHDGWQAADKPRVHFASESVLFKMYLLRELTGAGDSSLDRDPAVEFMQALVPTTAPLLFPTNQ
jgi:uncharacterized protein DUF3485